MKRRVHGTRPCESKEPHSAHRFNRHVFVWDCLGVQKPEQRVRVRVKDDTGMYAEVKGGPPSTHVGKEGFVVPPKQAEYDVGVVWNADDDPNWPCHFMWHELEVLK